MTIQLLEIQLNQCSQLRIVPTVLTIVPMIEIVCVFCLIKNWSQLSLPVFILMFLGGSVCICSIIPFTTIAAMLNTDSSELLMSWKMFGRNKYLRKQLTSFRPLKVKFGMNFIDKGTTLVTQNFCVIQIVSLLLMTK